MMVVRMNMKKTPLLLRIRVIILIQHIIKGNDNNNRRTGYDAFSKQSDNLQ